MFVRFDPFRDLDPARDLNRVANQALGASGRRPIPMDAVRSDEAVVLTFDLPGVDPDSVDLTVERRELTLTVSRDPVPVAADHKIIARERPHGSFRRTLHLNETLDPGRLEANFHNGELTVTIPVAETAQPRKVSIGSGAPAIDVGGEPVDEPIPTSGD